MIELFAFLLIYLIWFKPKRNIIEQKNYSITINAYSPEWCEIELNQVEIQQVESIVEQTLRMYPDAEVGKSFPEIRYKVLGDLYAEGQITKEYLHEQINLIIFESTGKG